MIDKSIRQHYEEGKKVNPLLEMGEKLTSSVKKKFLPQDDTGLDEKQLIKNVASSFLQNKLTRTAASKLAGTGILSSLGPIGMIIAAMLANKGINYAKGKIRPDIRTALQSFQQGMIGSPEEQKELRQLEKRRANLLQRKDEGKTYSDKNLGMVTRAIAEAKGIDINNPNEMKNIDEDISRLYSKTIYADPSVDSEESQPYNEDIITQPTVENIQANEDIITPTAPIRQDPDTGDASIAEKIAAENRAATQAAAIKAENDRQQREADAAAAAAARAAAAPVYSAPARPHGGGNGGGAQSSAGGYSRGDYGGRGHHWAKGGRV